ncbi:MAG: hypothetical protein HQL46_09480 [Gammaproteobacteria bacterium]|nr:hypothetical protein [Gammaproteobacteria bacterium]
MLIIDILVAGWCASCLGNKKNKNMDFGRRHIMHTPSQSACENCDKAKSKNC